MNRRSFIQSMAAAFGSVASGVRPNFAAEPPKIRYELFSDTQDFKWALSQPFSQDGTICATDAHIIVTHPGEWSGEVAGRLPNIAGLCWEEFDNGGWKELPSQSLEFAPRFECGTMCHLCMGTGRVGDGVHRVLGKDEDGDPIWRWTGGNKCHQCNGGWEDNFPHIERLGVSAFSPGYTNRLRTLGGLDYKVLEQRHLHDRHRVLLFRGENGVRGMLMSLAE